MGAPLTANGREGDDVLGLELICSPLPQRAEGRVDSGLTRTWPTNRPKPDISFLLPSPVVGEGLWGEGEITRRSRSLIFPFVCLTIYDYR